MASLHADEEAGAAAAAVPSTSYAHEQTPMRSSTTNMDTSRPTSGRPPTAPAFKWLASTGEAAMHDALPQGSPIAAREPEDDAWSSSGSSNLDAPGLRTAAPGRNSRSGHRSSGYRSSSRPSELVGFEASVGPSNAHALSVAATEASGSANALAAAINAQRQLSGQLTAPPPAVGASAAAFSKQPDAGGDGAVLQRARPFAASVLQSLPHGAVPTIITPNAALFQNDPVEEMIANFNMSRVIHTHLRQKKAWHEQQLHRLNHAREAMAAAQAACYRSVDTFPGALSRQASKVQRHYSSKPTRPSFYPASEGCTRPNTAPEQPLPRGSLSGATESNLAQAEGAYLSFPDASFSGTRPMKAVPERGVLFEKYSTDDSPASLVQHFYLRPSADRAAALAQQREAAAAAGMAASRTPAGASSSRPSSRADSQYPYTASAGEAGAGRSGITMDKALRNGVPRNVLDQRRATHEQGRSRASSRQKAHPRTSKNGLWDAPLAPPVPLTQTTAIAMLGDSEPFMDDLLAANILAKSPQPTSQLAGEVLATAADEPRSPGNGVHVAKGVSQRAVLHRGCSGRLGTPQGADDDTGAHHGRRGGQRHRHSANGAGSEAPVKPLMDDEFFEALQAHFREPPPVVEQTRRLRSKLNAELPALMEAHYGVKQMLVGQEGRGVASAAR